MILKVTHSPVAGKRYRATVQMHNGTIKEFDFGFPTATTYIDDPDLEKRYFYRIRHFNNPIEKTLITNLVPSPSLLSFALLWGKYPSIKKNVKLLNRIWAEKKTYHDLFDMQY